MQYTDRKNCDICFS